MIFNHKEILVSNYCIKNVYPVYWPKESKHWKFYKGLHYYTVGMGAYCFGLCELTTYDLFWMRKCPKHLILCILPRQKKK